MAWVVSTTVTPAARSSRTSSQLVAPGVRIQAGRRLVQEHQLGPADQRAGQVDGLLLAAGEPPVGDLGVRADAEPLDQRVDGQRWAYRLAEVAQQLSRP